MIVVSHIYILYACDGSMSVKAETVITGGFGVPHIYFRGIFSERKIPFGGSLEETTYLQCHFPNEPAAPVFENELNALEINKDTN